MATRKRPGSEVSKTDLSEIVVIAILAFNQVNSKDQSSTVKIIDITIAEIVKHLAGSVKLLLPASWRRGLQALP